ncbi:purine catabolism regulator [Kineococcus xinjiangensis]|uniref:Purine catabolism regulator n=1 Tax=Kineococcus xinjiangensis TaxID=512762 RepID=A0A2S6IT22_9ACTN|nr:PucR family transcriptional regulator [Kineococcus xinjiangensis]PPK97196.1 purine catabolism regulator [Kineococcus xinjiangensis]
MPTTLADVLRLDVLRVGEPEVLCGGAALGVAVRWVHVGEVADLTGLLQGGELILTTGLALAPGGPAAADLDGYLTRLHAAGACGLVVELGASLPAVPDALVRTGRRLGMPVVALHRRVRFVAVTEAVHARILDEQTALLRLSQQAHDAFSPLSTEGSTPEEIVTRAAGLAGAPVVLEDLAHHVVAFSALDEPASELLRDWEHRSRAAADHGGTGRWGPERWLTTPVGPRRQRWGRLVLPGPAALDVPAAAMVLERAAEALTVNRLVERDLVVLQHRAQGDLLADLVRGTAEQAELLARAGALGLPPAPAYLAVALADAAVRGPRRRGGARTAGSDALAVHRRDVVLAEQVALALRGTRTPALVSPVDAGVVAALVALPAARPEAAERLLGSLVAALERDSAPASRVLGVGPVVGALADAGGALSEARHVAEVAAATARPGQRPWFRSTDLRLRGLLTLLRDEPRLLAFSEAELGPLLARDDARGAELLTLLRAFLDCGGNKSELARRSHLSRPALYARLAALERLLGVDLDDGESRTSLHVALLVRDVHAGRRG